MTECQNCNSKLVTDGLQPGQRIRCANCQATFEFGTTEKVPANKLAWRSLWLGLASILLIFFTGIPAIYYGIKSLLRMRFVKSKPSDKAAAIAGTALGGCFGLFFGLIAVSILGIGLAAYLTSKTTDKPAEVVALCDDVFDFEVPTDFKPVQAREVFGFQKVFEFADDSDKTKRNGRIYLLFLGSNMTTNEPGLISTLKSRSVNSELGPVRSSELLQWKIFGEDADVRKTIFEAIPEVEGVAEAHQYFALIRRENGFYGMAVVFEPENISLSEEQVQAIFENLGIAAVSGETVSN